MKRVVVVAKQTTYSRMINEFGEISENHSPMIQRWRESHDRHMETLQKVINIIEPKSKMLLVNTSKTSFMTEMQDIDLVVTVGGDGTLLSASHHIHGNLPVLAVNSDPETSVGFFCTCDADSFEAQFERALETGTGIVLTRMTAKVNGRQVSNRVLNDVLFCHTNPASTSNYILEERASGEILFSEPQKSSGFWVGPPAGSTGARRSAGFKPISLGKNILQLCVRELYTKPETPPGEKEIIVEPGHSIHAISKMDSAAMYIDGDHMVIPVGLGDELSFEKSNDPLLLIGRPKDVFRQS